MEFKDQGNPRYVQDAEDFARVLSRVRDDVEGLLHHLIRAGSGELPPGRRRGAVVARSRCGDLGQDRVLASETAGWLALISTALTVIHSKLGCEQYQAECKRLVGFYRGIAEDYANLQLVNDIDGLRRRFFRLNDQFLESLRARPTCPSIGPSQTRRNASAELRP